MQGRQPLQRWCAIMLQDVPGQHRVPECSAGLQGLEHWKPESPCLLQIGKRIRSGITEPRRTAQHKRFLARIEDNKEVGFAMLRLGESFSLSLRSCLPAFVFAAA